MNGMQILSLFWLHTCIAILFAQAPGDEDAFCATVRPIVPPPSPYSPLNSITLMDSYNYVTLLSDSAEPSSPSVWQEVDVDVLNNPNRNSSTWAIIERNSPCRDILFSCHLNDSGQNNWLITQHISRFINGTLLPEVTVLLHVIVNGCSTGDCQIAFSLQVWETSTIDENAARTIANYRIVQGVIPPMNGPFVFDNPFVTIPVIFQTNATGFYLALVDDDACVGFARIIAYYNVCPQMVLDLIKYPETIPPVVTQPQPYRVQGECVNGASGELQGRNPSLNCLQGGIWGTVLEGTGCVCNNSYVRVNETCLFTNLSFTVETQEPAKTDFSTLSTIAKSMDNTGNEGNGLSVMEIIIISVTIAATLLVIFVVIVTGCFYFFNKKNKRKDDVFAELVAARRPAYPIYPTIYEDLPQVSETSMMTLPSLIDTLPKSLILDPDRIQIGKIIGQGEFGVVYKAFITSHMAGGMTVAVKTLKGIFATVQDIENLSQEILKMVQFDHLNVMSLIGVCTVPSNDSNVATGPCVVMPFMDRGSLLDQLRQNSDEIIVKSQDEYVISTVKNKLVQMSLQVAKGMEYITNLRFLHRDLAARNCLVDINGVIKVSDFGLAEDIYSQNYFRQASGSTKLPIKWMSLESITKGKFSEKTDVWSYGVTCWEIFTGGTIPYPGIHPHKLAEYLEGGKRLEKPRNEACDSDIFSMMQSCWLHKDTARPTFSEIVILLEGLLERNADYLDLTGVSTEPRPHDMPYENTGP